MRNRCLLVVHLMAFGSSLAAATACGKHVDGSARETAPTNTGVQLPTEGVNTNTIPKVPAQNANTNLPSAGSPREAQRDVPAPMPAKNSANAAGKGIIRLDAGALDRIVLQAKRKGTLVNVWATWCGPCREELPMLAKVQKAYAKRGIAVLPISVDEPDQESKIAPIMKEFGFTEPFYVASRPLEDLKRSLSEKWPGNIPVTFLLDRDTKRVFFWTAQVYEEELVPKLDLFLRGKLTPGRANFAVAPGKTL